MSKKLKFHMVTWALVLAVFWLLLSGFLKPLLLSFGVISVAIVLWLISRMDHTDTEQQKLALNLSFLRYIVWLLGQVVLSSLEVTKLIWTGSKNLSPAIAKLPVKKVPKRSRVLYANSITLTPGTLSIDINREHVTVHALNEESLESLRHGEMANKVYSGSGGEE